MTGDATLNAQRPDQPHPESTVSFTHATVQPGRWTFGADKICAWVERFLEGRVLNADDRDARLFAKDQSVTIVVGRDSVSCDRCWKAP